MSEKSPLFSRMRKVQSFEISMTVLDLHDQEITRTYIMTGSGGWMSILNGIIHTLQDIAESIPNFRAKLITNITVTPHE